MHQRLDRGQPATLLGRGGGAVECREKWPAQKYLGINGANFSVRTFYKNKNNIHVHLMMDNLSALSYTSKMGGTMNVINPLCNSQRSLGFLSTESNYFDREIPTWYSEQGIRLGVPKPQQLQRVETESSSVHPAPEANGSNGCGSICFQSQFSVESVCELEARSRSLEDLCSAFVLEKDTWIFFSSLCPDRQGTGKKARGQSNFSTDHTTVAGRATVSNTATVVHSNSNISTSVIRFVIRLSGAKTSPCEMSDRSCDH